MEPYHRMAILGISAPEPVSKDKKAEYDAILKRLPPGFGPGHPKWSVPSYRNKWLITQGVTFADASPQMLRDYRQSQSDPPHTRLK